jgi:HlyD family secretion protein
VVDADGKVEEREVKLGIQTDSNAEVLSGLSQGDSIVVSDRSGLKPGETVHPQVIELLQYHPQP